MHLVLSMVIPERSIPLVRGTENKKALPDLREVIFGKAFTKSK